MQARGSSNHDITSPDGPSAPCNGTGAASMLLRTVNLPLASSTVYPHTQPTFFYKLHRHRGHVICEASQVWLRLSAESDTNNDMRTCKSAYLVPTYPISPRAMTADLARRACRVSPPLLFFFPSCIAFQTHHSWNTGTANWTAAHEKTVPL